MILALRARTVSVACGHHTSSRGYRHCLQEPFPAPGKSIQLGLPGAVSRHKAPEHGGVGARADRRSDTDCCPQPRCTSRCQMLSHHFVFLLLSYLEFLSKAGRRKAEVQGSFCWPLLLGPATVCSSAHPSCSNEHPLWKFRLLFKSVRQYAVINPALMWMLSNKCAVTVVCCIPQLCFQPSSPSLMLSGISEV